MPLQFGEKAKCRQMPSPWSLLNLPCVRPSHISSQPVSDYPSPLRDKPSLHPLPAPCHLLPSSSPPSTPCWQPGQGRWPNLSVKAPSPRGNTTDTNYHTAGARPGNRMATTWSNQGTQQQGPEKAKKSEWVCLCVFACACVSTAESCSSYPKPSLSMSVGLTGSHCVFLISVSCVFSEDFQFKGKIYLHLSVDNQGFLLNTHSWIMTGSAGLTNHASMFQKEDESKFDLSMLGRFVPATHYRTIQNGARSHF